MTNLLNVINLYFSESDKDNSETSKDTSQNATDIGSHELIIESATNSSPKCDDSINKIFQNLSLLNNLQQKSSYGSVKKIFRNRLTKNFNSPLLKTSPLSSTPFTDKMRSKSIYQFSPIHMGDLEDSPNYVTVMEESELNLSDNEPKLLANAGSPNTHYLPDNISNVKKHSNLLFSFEDTNSKNSVVKRSNDNLPSNEIVTSKFPITQISLQPQNSEIEPFIGFSETTIAEAANEVITEEKNDSLILPSAKVSKGKQKSKDCSSVGKKQYAQDRHHISINENNPSIEQSMPVQPFLDVSKVDVGENLRADGLSNYNQDNYQYNDLEDHNNASSVTELTLDCINKELGENSKQGTESEGSLSVNLSDDSRYGHSASYSFERNSLYNTCNSEQSFEEDIAEVIKYPVVTLERMNTSLFNKYFPRMPEYASSLNDNSDSSKSSKDFGSFQNSYDNLHDVDCDTNEFEKDDNVDIKKDIEQSVYQLSETTLISEVSETIQDEEEECRSFVTTRRRNERTNSSTIFVLNDSSDSNSSAEFDKTVFSNKIDFHKDGSDVNINEKTECIEVMDTMLDNEKYKKTEANVRASRNVDVSGEQHVHENVDMLENDHVSEIKPNIVLQPGKKWERSLSIYRRMTMMNDPIHHSILDEEDLQLKGRKYRQSVMDTMELQDQGYLLFLTKLLS